MAKKIYMIPLILGGLTPGEGGEIILPPSQGTSGFDSMWTFSGIDEDTLEMIQLNCDDFDFEEMDADGDYVITLEEFNEWFSANEPW